MKNKKWIILVGVFFILMAVFLYSEGLTVRHIVIIGNKHLNEKEIRSIIGIKEGSSIIYPSSKSLYERLKKTPWIKDAIIRKDLNGTITIYIKESSPVAVAMFNEKAYLIDYEAQILEDFTQEIQASANHKPLLLPVIKNIDPFKNRETFEEAVKLLNFISNKGFIKTEDEITITGNNPDTLTLYINDFPIIVGKGDFEIKFAKYLIVNAEIQKRGLNVQYIDLRFPDRVIVKPVQQDLKDE
ncbi:FtsQ-type POTRA domain-containing protein [Thermodesulfovibrio sp. 3462-1]|jgi:cell division protein FtsQ|uniref:FtsQ-type POTRA domain-containing protein n=1 Tax=Thermodesulfovibrio obliviosus TaxID=3118332 RepID=A0AAU8H6Y7_9BACT